MKPRLIIWGGWWDKNAPYSVDNINSHASVTAYFLANYLSEFYDISNILNFNSAESILNENNAIAVLSTYSHGFTRLVERGREREFKRIRQAFKGRLCSIDDGLYPIRYKEDILFPINPPAAGIRFLVKNFLAKNIVIERCGWAAEPALCFPEAVSDREINIFVDHGLYKSGLDCSHVYFDAFKEASRIFPEFSFNVYRQNNDGIVKWNLKGSFKEPRFLRSSKMPYLDLLKFYRRCHIFCATHPESAGIAAIEAAMCGAKLYVPSNFLRSYISGGLLKDGVEHTNFGCSKRSIISALRKDIEKGFDRGKWRSRLLKTNTWKVAAGRIHRVLSEAV